jgi:hypothetical protein
VAEEEEEEEATTYLEATVVSAAPLNFIVEAPAELLLAAAT